MKGGTMESQVKLWPPEFSVTAATWPTLSRDVKDALEADLIAAGFRVDQVRGVEYIDGELYSVTILTRR